MSLTTFCSCMSHYFLYSSMLAISTAKICSFLYSLQYIYMYIQCWQIICCFYWLKSPEVDTLVWPEYTFQHCFAIPGPYTPFNHSIIVEPLRISYHHLEKLPSMLTCGVFMLHNIRHHVQDTLGCHALECEGQAPIQSTPFSMWHPCRG